MITCDVAQINEKLHPTPPSLTSYMHFLSHRLPLTLTVDKFLSKAFGVLISQRPEQNWYSYQYTCLQVIEFSRASPKFRSFYHTLGPPQ